MLINHFWVVHNFGWGLIKVSQTLRISQMQISACSTLGYLTVYHTATLAGETNQIQLNGYTKYLVSVENRIGLVFRLDGNIARFEYGLRNPWANTQNWHKIQLSHSNFWYCRNWMRWQQIRLVCFVSTVIHRRNMRNVQYFKSHLLFFVIRQMAMLSKYLKSCFGTP